MRAAITIHSQPENRMNQLHQQGTASFLRRLTWLSCAMLLGSVGAVGQVTVLRHVTVIDGNGGAPRHDATVVIDGAKIRSVTSGPTRIPGGAKTIDLTGKTIMPELVNAHGHLGLLQGTKTSAANYTEDNCEASASAVSGVWRGRRAGDGH
jgi:imidazolonepropionase-like amidohydrolase